MNDEQRKKCKRIIHTAATAAAGVGSGFAQLPGSDNAVITPIQITMIISLGAVFGKRIDKSIARATLATATAATAGRTISQFLVGWVPAVGNIINASTAAAITETIGWAVANDFAENE